MFSPAEIADLALSLRKAGFAVGNEQLRACGQLVHGSRRFDAELICSPDFAAYLAPIFCQDSTQQARFARVYQDWLGCRALQYLPGNDAVNPSVVPEASSAHAGVASSRQPPPAAWHTGLRWPGMTGLSPGRARAGMMLLVGLALVIFAWLNFDPGRAGAPQVVQSSPPEASVAAHASMSASAVPPVAQVPVQVLPLVLRLGADFWPCMALAALLAATLVFGVYFSAPRRAFLQRLPAGEHDIESRFVATGERPLQFMVDHLRQLSIALQHRQWIPSRQLDVVATLAGAVRAGGYINPVFGSKVAVEYLILVDKAAPGDQQACLFDELIRFLQSRGVSIERYEFDADPRRARHVPLASASPLSGMQTLEQLAARHEHARLLLCSDGSGLIDPYTGEPYGWLPRLQAWSKPVLLTPQTLSRFGMREWLLVNAGLTLLPFGVDGFQSLARLYEVDTPALPLPEAMRQRQRPLYLKDIDLLLDKTPPRAAAINHLLIELHRDLGEAGIAWLAGCALYPQLNWHVTLFLGRGLQVQGTEIKSWQIASSAQQVELLTAMVHLPWLRHGYMPDWLRIALIECLHPACFSHLQAGVQMFMATLSPGSPAPASERPDLHELPIVLPDRLREWLAIWLAYVRRTAPPVPGTLAQDKVFLRFMSRGSPLEPAADKHLNRLLYQDGLRLAGLRRLPFLLPVLAGVAIMLWRPPLVPDKPLSEFQDVLARGEKAPLMVIMPAGRFRIGSDERSDEKKGAIVNIRQKFAIGKFEVSLRQYQACVKAAACNEPEWVEAGSLYHYKTGSSDLYRKLGDGLLAPDSPVVGVSWQDAQSYVAWLNRSGTPKHGRYRLPSEAEWEYMARAGSTTRYVWGQQISHDFANYGKEQCCDGLVEGKDRWLYLAPVDSFVPNRWGIYNAYGNVWEWVEDDWHNDYAGAPGNGSAWRDRNGLQNRVVRGGAWDSNPDYLRAPRRGYSPVSTRSSNIGFRVALTLP